MSLGILISGLRLALKLAIKSSAALCAMAFRLNKTRGEGLRVLLYHRVNSYPFSRLSMTSREIRVTTKQFESQLAYLKAQSFESVGLAEAEAILSGQQAPNDKKLLITFDDGYEDNLLYAVPLLEKYGFTAVFFLVTGFMEEGRAKNLWYEEGSHEEYRKFLTWPQVKSLHDAGFCIGSHSVSHPDLNHLDPNRLSAELDESKQAIEQHLGSSVKVLAYPRGIYNDDIINAAVKSGYRMAFTTEVGKSPMGSSLMTLRRTDISCSDNLFVFKQKMAGNLDWFDIKQWRLAKSAIEWVNRLIIENLRNERGSAD